MHGAQRLGGSRDRSRGGVHRLGELGRFGLRPYLPQGRRRWHPPHHNGSLLRRYPLFPRYVLLPLKDSRAPSLALCRGLRRFKPILSDAEGRPWRAPDDVVDAVREAEARGDFDEIFTPGNKVAVTKGVLAGIEAVLTANASYGRVEVLMPLFGGVKVFVPQASVARAWSTRLRVIYVTKVLAEDVDHVDRGRERISAHLRRRGALTRRCGRRSIRIHRAAPGCCVRK